MITHSPLENLLTCLAFWAILVWALWQGEAEWEEWLREGHDGHDDIRDFPDEVRGEPGPAYFFPSASGRSKPAPTERNR